MILGNEDIHYSLSHKAYQLETGKAYQLKIIASGQKEYAFQAPEFSTSIFLRKIEASGVEIKAITLTELELEDEGQAEIFIPIKPGQYRLYAKGLDAKCSLAFLVK